ncbi:MAG TPA: sigma-70 family RNA polymerase sigma factor [Planctomycetaceae bacterium]|nr:sigma-70 family RNA polymerase sigma factor [Planctomycetaceae bacterium]
MNSTSVNLLERLREPQAESAWQRFVELYAPLVFYWARQKGLNADDASDLLQDVLATLLTKLPEFQYDPDRRFRGWLRTITVNRVTDMHRRNAIRSLQTELDSTAVLNRLTQADSNDLFIESEYRAVVINGALDLLRSEFQPVTWQACWLQIVEGQPASAVASQLNIPLNSVYLAKSRVLARLRQELEGLMD